MESEMVTETKAGEVSKQAEVDALVITGAAMVGMKDGVEQVAENKAEFVRKALEPGDQRHLAHPLDDLVTNTKHLVSDISNKIETAYSAGDMNLGHSQARQPHPIENTSLALSVTYETLAEKGAVEGTRAASAMVAAGITETIVTPSGKAKAVKAIADITTEAKAITGTEHAIHGEYIAANEANKAIAHPLPESNPEAKMSIKDKLMNNPAVKMFAEVINPPLDTRIALEAHKARPNILDYIDETHKSGGDVEALLAENLNRIHRAEKLSDVIRDNPALMAQNGKISDEEIRALINDTSRDARLGLEHNASNIAKLPSEKEQLRIDAHNDRLEQAKTAADIATNGTKDMTTGGKILHHLTNNVRGYTGLGYDMGKGELARLEEAR